MTDGFKSDSGPLRWVIPPDDDHSDHANFRREIAALAREAMGLNQPSAGADAPQSRDSRAALDVRGETPFRIILLARDLARDVAGPDPGSGVGRDLLLMEIGRRGAVMAPALRRFLGLTPSTLTGLVGQAVSDGLVEARRSLADRRMKQLSLTVAGEAAAGEAARRWHRADEALLARLSPSERDSLRRLARAARREPPFTG